MKVGIVTTLILFTVELFAQKRFIKVNGKKRQFTVHLPQGYTTAKKHPLVLNFHGLSAGNHQQKRYSRMNEIADKEGFIVIYPRGIFHFWKTGVGREKYNQGIRDLQFVKTLLDTLVKDYPIDTTRIYSCGMSLGGYFSYRLACEMGHRFAAIASVTGVISDSTKKYCTSASSTPILQIHGTRDPIVKYSGIRQSLGAEATVNFWVDKNRCKYTADTSLIPDVCSRDKTTAQLIKFSSCESNDPVWFVKIENGGHTWPGTKIDYLFLGKTNMDFKASELIWLFFKQFHK